MPAHKERADIAALGDELQRANYAISVRRYDLAIEIMQRALSVNPENSVAFYTMGRAYVKKEQYPQALEALKETLRLNPEDSIAHALYGWVLGSTGQLELAGRELCTAIELDPLNQYAHYEYARFLYYRLKDLEKARIHCLKALELDPEDANSHCLFGNILASEGAKYIWRFDPNREKLLDQAEAQYRKALSIDPELAYVHNWYGVLLLNQMRKPRKAHEHFRLALMYDPNNQIYQKNFLIRLKAKYRAYWFLGLAASILACVYVPEMLSISIPIVFQVCGPCVFALRIYCFRFFSTDPLYHFLVKHGWL